MSPAQEAGAEPLADFVITPHARMEMARRSLSEEIIAWVLAHPGQRLDVGPGRAVYQSQVETSGPAGVTLVRVFVDVNRRPAEIVTAYRTSKVIKYWRGPT